MHNKSYKTLILGIKKPLEFRALNLSDENWIQETFPDYLKKSGEESIDLVMFCKILFRQLVTLEVFESADDMMKHVMGDDCKIEIMDTFSAVCQLSRPNISKNESDLLKKKRKLNQSITILLSTSLLLAITGVILILRA